MRKIKIDIPSEKPSEIVVVLTKITWKIIGGRFQAATGTLNNGKSWSAKWEEIPDSIPGNLGQLLGGLRVMSSSFTPDDVVIVSDKVGKQMQAIAEKEQNSATV
jgi:hypothetical protein